MERLEPVILRSLIYDDQYVRRVLPFIDPAYFQDKMERILFRKLKEFLNKFNAQPTKEALIIDFDSSQGVQQDDMDAIVSYLNNLESQKDDKPNSDWIVERTEEWCQEKAIYNAVLEAWTILEGTNGKKQRGVIPKLLQDALAVSFDPHVGHDYFGDANARYEFYHRVDSRIPFHLDYLNRITKNGVPNKTLNICLAGTNVGKSLFMCDLAASYLMQGKNVLYITLEMAEERIAERIDANLMDRPIDDLPSMSHEAYFKAVQRINGRTKGRLMIKEYPTAQANVDHFRHLLNELNLKMKFKPDAIFIDYLNICASNRVRSNSGGGMYELVKSIAEELRGLGVEFNVPIWSATQMNRAGFNNSDPDLTNTSESFGLPATADFMFALVSSDELKAMNQLMVKILKNRYGDVHLRNKEDGKIANKFLIGVDRSKQKLYNLEDRAQDSINQDLHNATGPEREALLADPVFECDTYNPASDDAERRRESAKFGKRDFFTAGRHKPNV